MSKYFKNNIEISKTDYLRGKELKNGQMESVYHSDGRAIKSGNNWKYEYHVKDHLGNVRVTFSDDNGNGLITGNELRSRNDYYSFGLGWNGAWVQRDSINPKNKYKYNGKELVEEMGLNILYFGARNLDPSLGRWFNVDMLSDQYAGLSPYNYVGNRPNIFTDPNGMGVDSTRVYNLNGQFQFNINDDLPNEDHFLSAKSLNELASTCCSDANHEGTIARKKSTFFIGSKTRTQLKNITKISDKEQKERAFGLTIGNDKELVVNDITDLVNRLSGTIILSCTAVTNNNNSNFKIL